MGSRWAVATFAQTTYHLGICREFLPTYAVFSFANSDKSVANEKCRIWFPTDPPCQTDVDICEQGHVPILCSLPQLRLLRLTTEPTPEAVYLTCDAFDYKRKPSLMATSQHVVLDLADLKPCPKE